MKTTLSYDHYFNYAEMKEAVREGMESVTVTIRIGERSAKRTLRDLGVEVVV